MCVRVCVRMCVREGMVCTQVSVGTHPDSVLGIFHYGASGTCFRSIKLSEEEINERSSTPTIQVTIFERFVLV